MRILYVGPDYPGSNGTCWRDAFVELGHEVLTLDDEKYDPAPASLAGRLIRKARRRPGAGQVQALNCRIASEAARFAPHLIFFVKGYFVEPDTLATVRRIAPCLVYMNDDMFNPANQTPYFFPNIPLYDLILTTKSYNVREFERAGAQRAAYIPNAYDPHVHFPAEPSPQERAQMGGDVAFIGTFRPNRADFLARVANLWDLRLSVWGGGWRKMGRFDNLHRRHRWRALERSVQPRELWCGEMGKAIRSNAVTLGLLYRENRDLHTSRSFEIPACCGFMLAERTEEHRLYFEEDREAAYFSSFDELTDKLRFYVAHEEIRARIARAGYQRCLASPYRYTDRARFAIEQSGVKPVLVAGSRLAVSAE
jgi:spore maturation protein CgeB